MRTLDRLAALLCPGPPDSLRQTVEKVESYVGSLPPPLRFAFAAAVAAVDQGARLYPPARGRRLLDLDSSTAERYLALVFGGRLPLAGPALKLVASVVALCHYDVPEVRARLGYEPDGHIARVAQRRLELHGEEIREAEEALLEGSSAEAVSAARPPGLITDEETQEDLELECGAVVVGSGAGGATMAAELAAAGIDVLLVEEGGYHPSDSFGTDVVHALRTLYRSGGAQTIVGRPPITFLEGRCVGGSTVVNGGMCWRPPARVLKRWSEDEGIEAIGPEDMERHFDKVEARLSIGPQEPESIGRDSELLRQGAEALDWQLVHSPRNQLHCGGCDNCLCGCPTGAKRSMLVTNVRRALARDARLVAGCRIERVTSRRRFATGVVGRFVDEGGRLGRKLTVRAPVVVAACGAIQTPALLSRSGLRPRSGQLGRNLSIHPSAALLAIFDHEVRGWEGVHQGYQITEFIRDGILVTASTLPPASVASNVPQHGGALRELMQDYNRMVVAGCLVDDTATGRVHALPGLGPVAHYSLRGGDSERLVRGLSHAAELMFAAGAPRVVLPIEGAPGPLDADSARAFLRRPIRPRDLRPFTVHAMGTARLSADATRGVVSSFGELHDAVGVFVADASVLPGSVGVNPMETIVAVAARNAERLIERRERYGI